MLMVRNQVPKTDLKAYYIFNEGMSGGSKKGGKRQEDGKKKKEALKG